MGMIILIVIFLFALETAFSGFALGAALGLLCASPARPMRAMILGSVAAVAGGAAGFTAGIYFGIDGIDAATLTWYGHGFVHILGFGALSMFAPALVFFLAAWLALRRFTRFSGRTTTPPSTDAP